MRILMEYTMVLKGHSTWTSSNSCYFTLWHNNNYNANFINSSLGFRIIKTTKIC